ncbi:hemerythrin domain-containing protein [Egibacter rhizosphaerae]|uniref:Hemerythrin domain-containing protein n=1 Tax=Egibacter rhizosphaerae TaxID=1670831 RepID=A0A411YB68_9ACTN|nr:hemerythrin domain-containing protein [Egibacter rhizosphaerae]QBI18436.1 hemerythrin domain-containing protein [Egibacter rhizosphaerae]
MPAPTEPRDARVLTDDGPPALSRGTAGPRHHTALTQRLAEISELTPYLEWLITPEIRGQLAGMLGFLHDDVLHHAHEEERVIFPPLERLGPEGERLRAALLAEHDTLREAAARLDACAVVHLDQTTIPGLAGLMRATEALLAHHLDQEALATERLLVQLPDWARQEVAEGLERLDALEVRPGPGPDEWWLPERIAHKDPVAHDPSRDPEWRASCDPRALVLARSAAAAAADGTSVNRWRQAILQWSGYRRHVDTVERCMREAGEWPWSIPSAG